MRERKKVNIGVRYLGYNSSWEFNFDDIEHLEKQLNATTKEIVKSAKKLKKMIDGCHGARNALDSKGEKMTFNSYPEFSGSEKTVKKIKEYLDN